MDAEKTCCSRVLGIVRELSSDCYSKIIGESDLPYSRHISLSLEEISKEELDMRGAQERKKDKDDQQQVLTSSGKSNPSTSLTNTPPSPSAVGVTAGRIGRQNSFALKPSYGVTPSDPKTSLKGTVLRGVATPTFLLVKEEDTLEESRKKPLVFIRPTERVGTGRIGRNDELDLDIDEDEKEPQTERVETGRTGWKGELDLDIDEDENEPQIGGYSSTPCSLIKTVVCDKAEDEDDKSLSPLFSTPRQRFDRTSHTSDLEAKEVNLNVKAIREKEGSEGFSGRSTTSTSPTSSTSSSLHRSSTSTLSEDDRCNVHDKPLTPALTITTKLYINQAPSTTSGDQPKAQPEQHKAGRAGAKIPSPSCIVYARCPMRTQETRYVRRSSSSCVPTQESDLLKEWARKSLEELEERENKSINEQKKILEAARRTLDAFYEQHRVDTNLKRAQNRQQEKQVVEETSNHPKFQKSTNPWCLVVSLVNLERPTGPPVQEADTKRLSPSSVGPPSLSTKVLPTNAAIKDEKTNLAGSNSAIKQDNTNLTGPTDRVIEQIPPPLKNTDLSRMKEVLVKLKYKPPVREGDGK